MNWRFPALAQRDFRLYFIGQAISLIGSFAHHVALGWLAYRLSGSALVLGVVGFAATIPTLFISPFAGLLGDRFARKAVLLVLLSVAAAHCVVLALLTALGWLSVGWIIVLALIRGVIFAAEVPVRHAFIADLIEDRKLLPNAIAVHSSALNLARLIGPAIGGVLIAWMGEALCFALNAATLLVVVAMLIRTRPRAPTATARTGSPWAQLREGLVYAWASPPIRSLLTAIAVVGVTTAPYAALMPAAVSEILHARPELVGSMLASAGLGSVLAALLLATRTGVRGLARRILVATVCAGGGLALFSFSAWIWLSMLCMAVMGFGIISQAASTNMILQSIVDEDKRARVMSIYTASFIGAAPLGALLIGQLSEWIGTARALGISAAACLAGAACYAARLSALRQSLAEIYRAKGIDAG
jgi:MFS family permease